MRPGFKSPTVITSASVPGMGGSQFRFHPTRMDGASLCDEMKRPPPPSRFITLPEAGGQVYFRPVNAGTGWWSGHRPRDWHTIHERCTSGMTLNSRSRKPMLLLRLPGSLLLRFADRQFLALLFQLPPRLTRPAP